MLYGSAMRDNKFHTSRSAYMNESVTCIPLSTISMCFSFCENRAQDAYIKHFQNMPYHYLFTVLKDYLTL